jgi:hypothetical protein
LVQRSIRLKKVIKNFGKIINATLGDHITIIIKTHNGKHVIVGSTLGVLYLFNLETHRISGYGELGGYIGGLATTHDGEYLFVASNRDLFCFSMKTQENVMHLKFDAKISSMVMTMDEKFLFCGNTWGNLTSIDIDKRKFSSEFVSILDNGIKTMIITRDNKFLIVAGSDGDSKKPATKHHVKKFSIEKGKLVKNFGLLCENTVQSIQLGPGYNSLFAYDELCNLKEVKLTDDRTLPLKGPLMQTLRGYPRRTMPTIADYGNVGNGFGEGGQTVLVSRDGRYIFATSGRLNGGWNSCTLKQFNVRGEALLGD